VTAETIAKRGRCSVRKVNMMISIAFLTPDLVKAGIERRLPRGMGAACLCYLTLSISDNSNQSLPGGASLFPGNGILGPETSPPNWALPAQNTIAENSHPQNKPQCAGCLLAFGKYL